MFGRRKKPIKSKAIKPRLTNFEKEYIYIGLPKIERNGRTAYQKNSPFSLIQFLKELFLFTGKEVYPLKRWYDYVGLIFLGIPRFIFEFIPRFFERFFAHIHYYFESKIQHPHHAKNLSGLLFWGFFDGVSWGIYKVFTVVRWVGEHITSPNRSYEEAGKDAQGREEKDVIWRRIKRGISIFVTLTALVSLSMLLYPVFSVLTANWTSSAALDFATMLGSSLFNFVGHLLINLAAAFGIALTTHVAELGAFTLFISMVGGTLLGIKNKIRSCFVSDSDVEKEEEQKVPSSYGNIPVLSSMIAKFKSGVQSVVYPDEDKPSKRFSSGSDQEIVEERDAENEVNPTVPQSQSVFTRIANGFNSFS